MGKLDLKIPKVRKGRSSPVAWSLEDDGEGHSVSSPGSLRSGVSTRKVDDLVKR